MNKRVTKIKQKLILYKGSKPEIKTLRVKFSESTKGRVYAEFYDYKGNFIGDITETELNKILAKKGEWKQVHPSLFIKPLR